MPSLGPPPYEEDIATHIIILLRYRLVGYAIIAILSSICYQADYYATIIGYDRYAAGATPCCQSVATVIELLPVYGAPHVRYHKPA